MKNLNKKTNKELVKLANEVFAKDDIGCSCFTTRKGYFYHTDMYEGHCKWTREELIYNITEALKERGA